MVLDMNNVKKVAAIWDCKKDFLIHMKILQNVSYYTVIMSLKSFLELDTMSKIKKILPQCC